jgi:hypothetical protein
MSIDKQWIFDSQRQTWLQLSLEEQVRQQLVDYLCNDLGFPKSLVVTEKSLSQFPHLKNISELPKRRIDIVCFAKNIHPKHELYPLLLIECKGKADLNEKVKRQLLGYNHYVQAYYVAMANEQNLQTGWYDSKCKEYRFVPYLPTYDQLINSIAT